MITLLTILGVIVGLTIIIGILFLVGGTGLLLMFGDLIVAVLAIYGLIKLFTRKKKK